MSAADLLAIVQPVAEHMFGDGVEVEELHSYCVTVRHPSEPVSLSFRNPTYPEAMTKRLVITADLPRTVRGSYAHLCYYMPRLESGGLAQSPKRTIAIARMIADPKRIAAEIHRHVVGPAIEPARKGVKAIANEHYQKRCLEDATRRIADLLAGRAYIPQDGRDTFTASGRIGDLNVSVKTGRAVTTQMQITAGMDVLEDLTKYLVARERRRNKRDDRS